VTNSALAVTIFLLANEEAMHIHFRFWHHLSF